MQRHQRDAQRRLVDGPRHLRLRRGGDVQQRVPDGEPGLAVDDIPQQRQRRHDQERAIPDGADGRGGRQCLLPAQRRGHLARQRRLQHRRVVGQLAAQGAGVRRLQRGVRGVGRRHVVSHGAYGHDDARARLVADLLDDDGRAGRRLLVRLRPQLRHHVLGGEHGHQGVQEANLQELPRRLPQLRAQHVVLPQSLLLLLGAEQVHAVLHQLRRRTLHANGGLLHVRRHRVRRVRGRLLPAPCWRVRGGVSG
mmetsp:Transcript_18597/g.65758  ORF Transcript_18597/g.65758 Transcript_18597/m.65758 type:complete len:251 (+) Transcript_18597:683-1435(+)